MDQIILDFRKSTIWIPASIYDALEKPKNAGLVYSPADGLLVIVRELHWESPKKLKAGRPAKRRSLFEESNLTNGMYWFRPARFRDYSDHIPAFIRFQSYSVEGKWISSSAISFDLAKAIPVKIGRQKCE